MVWPGWSPDVATSSLPPPLMSLVKPEDNLSCYAIWQQDEDGGDGDGDRDQDLKEFPRMESKTFRAFPHPVRQLFHPLSLPGPFYTPSFIPSPPNPHCLLPLSKHHVSSPSLAALFFSDKVLCEYFDLHFSSQSNCIFTSLLAALCTKQRTVHFLNTAYNLH